MFALRDQFGRVHEFRDLGELHHHVTGLVQRELYAINTIDFGVPTFVVDAVVVR
jgi:hypothetical protein